MRRLFAILFILLSACAARAAPDEAALKMGVLAYRPKPQVLAQWQPVAAYLEKTLGRRVELNVYDHAELADAAAQRAVDVVFTTANHFILLQHTAGVSAALATLITREGGQELSGYGGVIFTRTERDDIRSLADLAGKRIAAVSTDAFGGFQMQAAELVEAGLPVPAAARLRITGQPHDRVIEAILVGNADAGFVRAGVIEAMAKEGRLDPRRIKVINRQNLPAFPYAVSTRLYPEWPVAVMPQVDEKTASRLVAALFLLPRSGVGGIAGFTTPANYAGVENLMRHLRLPPFDQAPDISLRDLWRRYAAWIVALGGLVLLLAAASTGLIILYRRSWHSLHALARQAEKEKLLLSSLDEGVYGVDAEGKCIFINPRALGMLGYTESEVLGRNAHCLFHKCKEDDSVYPLIGCPVSQTLRDGRKREVEDSFMRREGGWFPVLLGVSAMRHGETIIGAVVAFQDITERKQAEEALKKSETLLNATQRLSKVGGWEFDVKSGKFFWTEELYRIHEIPNAPGIDHIKESLACYRPEDRQIIYEAFRRACERGESYDLEFPFTTYTGKPLWIRTTAQPVYEEGKVARLVGNLMDITEHKQAEARIRMLNQELEQRVAERTAQLETAVYDLENFNYSASHDLRIPLRAVDGFSRILLDEYSGKLDAEGVRLLNVVRDNTKRMAQYIEDMLSFSNVGRMVMAPAEIDMKALVREVADELMTTTAGHEIKLEIQNLPPINADRPMMRRAMLNLLANAFKFSRPIPNAAVEVGAKVEGNETVYYVKDNGVGFDMQYAEKLFGVFQRLHNVDEFEGTGIGLAIVKRIINRHGGRVWAVGRVNEGATIFFALPVKERKHG